LKKLPIGAIERNSAVWRDLYAAGKNDLLYPNDTLVRLGAHLFDREHDTPILDYGFGTGANLAHFAQQGFAMHGVEISKHALVATRDKLDARGLAAELHLIEPGQALPFPDNYFSIVYSWQVLYYNDMVGWHAAVRELERVAAADGLILLGTAAPGDVSQIDADPLGNCMYRLKIAAQKGCIVTIPDRRSLRRFFPARRLEIGEFGYSFRQTRTRFWIVSYRVPKS
jgi:SAM-dependent methyltransferase